MKSILKLSAIVFLFLFYNGCKEKENTPVTYTFSLDSARAYIWADTGSYWVYRQSQTGDLDTQKVLSAVTYWGKKKGTMDYSKHITVNYENMSRTLFSSYFKYKIYDETLSPNPDASTFQGKRFASISRVISSEGVNLPFFYPFVRNRLSLNSSSQTVCVIDDTTFSLQNKTYQHVAVFEVKLDEVEEGKFNCYNPNTRYYWAKGVGLIRKEMITCGYAWDLVEYRLK